MSVLARVGGGIVNGQNSKRGREDRERAWIRQVVDVHDVRAKGAQLAPRGAQAAWIQNAAGKLEYADAVVACAPKQHLALPNVATEFLGVLAADKGHVGTRPRVAGGLHRGVLKKPVADENYPHVRSPGDIRPSAGGPRHRTT
jgi:hypothetical protein